MRSFLSKQSLRISQFSSVQLLSRILLFETPWTAERQSSLCITDSRILLKFMSIESVIPSNHLILLSSCPLLLLPSVFPSIRVFSNKSVLHIRWPKYRSFSFSFSPSNEHPGLISFRIDWLDLAGQVTIWETMSCRGHWAIHGDIFKCSQFSSVAQLCPTLCDPIDGSPLRSPIPGILQGRTLQWVARSN